MNKSSGTNKAIFILQLGGCGPLGVFGVIWGQNSKIFKPRQIIHQNEALGPVIKKEWLSRSSDPGNGGI